MVYTRGGHTSDGVYIYEDGEAVAVVFVQDPHEARRIARELVEGPPSEETTDPNGVSADVPFEE